MPDLTELNLNRQLSRERADLLDAIAQPPLARIGERAARRRRHRRARRVGVVAFALATAATLALRPWAGDAQQPPVGDQQTHPGPVYSDAGITINGLTGDVVDVPGTIVDIEFADPDHGYLVAHCATGDPCQPSVARTSDGGVTWTWTATDLPAAGGDLDLLVFPDGRLALGGLVSADEGRTWQTPASAAGQPATIGEGEELRARGGAVEVWSPEYGHRGALASQPELTVSWVAARPTADGGWWAGGLAGGQPAAAVTRDGGRHWTVSRLDATGSLVQVSVLGHNAYAVVLGEDRTIRAVFESADSGRTFTRTTAGPVTVPGGLAGEVVPLLDGRLLIAGTDQRWYVSADDGRTFTRAEGTLPAVGRLAHTAAGYVAYDLFQAGWAAFSTDGSTWRKLQIR